MAGAPDRHLSPLLSLVYCPLSRQLYIELNDGSTVTTSSLNYGNIVHNRHTDVSSWLSEA